MVVGVAKMRFRHYNRMFTSVDRCGTRDAHCDSGFKGNRMGYCTVLCVR